MNRQLRLSSPLLGALLVGCAANSAVRVSADVDCPRTAYRDTTFLIPEATRLAGRFRLVMLNTQSSGWDTVLLRQGTLELWPTDSLRLTNLGSGWARNLRERIPLGGAMHFDGATAALEEWVGTVDRRRPRVEFIANRIQMGDVMVTDGHGWSLQVLDIETSAFRGTWTQFSGLGTYYDPVTGRRLEDPGGWFCATRIE